MVLCNQELQGIIRCALYYGERISHLSGSSTYLPDYILIIITLYAHHVLQVTYIGNLSNLQISYADRKANVYSLRLG